MEIASGTRFGPHEITGLLGAGGMGEVYRARDTQLQRDVAIKVLSETLAGDASWSARFKREAEVLASLNQPNIAQIYGLERTAEGTAALVMELVEGETLAARIASQGPLPPEEALGIAAQIAAALEAAHGQGVVHRDLKPANVKLKPDGTVKVLDFGIAKVRSIRSASGRSDAPLTTPALTELGVVLGTAAYMSPEQARGRPIDERADIWAFGCVLYEMLAGRAAFAGEDATATLARVLERDADMGSLPAELPAGVRRTLELCLRKDPKQRIADIRDVALGLAGALVEAGSAHSASSAVAPSFWARHAKLAASLAAASALAAAVMSIVHFREPVTAEPTLRYTIPLPTEGGAEGSHFHYHLSPDGRFLAVSAVLEQTAGIFVRALDALEWRHLPGTAISDFFWSPDSQSMAFFADGRLKKVAVDGGPPQDLAGVGAGPYWVASGAWGDGTLVVAPPGGGALLAVPAGGGEPRRLGTAEPGATPRYPAFLPDGRHYLYTRLGGSSAGVYVASLDDPAGRRVLADASSAIFAPSPAGRRDGHLLFRRDGRLLAQPFDANARELRGEAFVVVERALPRDNGAVAVTASNGGTVAFLAGRNRERDSRLVWVDRTGTILEASAHAGSPVSVALSPDERLAAIVRDGDVALWDVERDLETPFTFDAGASPFGNAVWSPDGARIAHVSVTPESTDILVRSAPMSGAADVLLGNGNLKSVTDWSADYLVYTEVSAETGADLWYLPMQGARAPDGEPVPFRRDAFNTSFGRISPDGRWIAYLSDETGGSDLWVQSFPSGAGKWRISGTQSWGTTQQPRWSRDGSELFFVAGGSGRATMMAAPVDAPARPGASPVGEPRPLFEARINNYDPFLSTFFYDVSNDGQRFLINAVDEGTDPVITVVVNGRELR